MSCDIMNYFVVIVLMKFIVKCYKKDVQQMYINLVNGKLYLSNFL